MRIRNALFPNDLVPSKIFRDYATLLAMSTLIEDAKKSAHRQSNHRPVTTEELELAVAFFNDEISARQVGIALHVEGSTHICMYHVGRFIRAGIHDGRVRLIRVEP